MGNVTTYHPEDGGYDGQSLSANLPNTIQRRMDSFELTFDPWKLMRNIDSSMSYEDIVAAIAEKYPLRIKGGVEIGCEAAPEDIRQYMQVVREIVARDYALGLFATSINDEITSDYENVMKAVNEKTINERSADQEASPVGRTPEPIDKDRPILYVPVAIPGAGKSTWARTNGYCNLVFSSDEVRKELGYGAGKGNDVVFPEVNRRTVEALRCGRSCIYDATNLDFHRDELIRSIKEQVSNVRVVAVVFHVPLAECLERNASREGFARVPDHIIRRMNERMTPPTKEAGFDYIIDLKWDKDHETEAQKESMDKFAEAVRNEDRSKDVGIGYDDD